MHYTRLFAVPIIADSCVPISADIYNALWTDYVTALVRNAGFGEGRDWL